jgi:hypothetical protein
MPPTECADEQTTQHHLGTGYGPVKGEEHVLVAVFQNTDRDGNRLAATAFKPKVLRRSEFSMARAAYINKAEFEAVVIGPQTAAQGPLLGVVLAEVSKLRGLQFEFQRSYCRSVCVTDQVTPQDFEAHAALGYSETQNSMNLSDKQKKAIRATIHADLADQFGDVLTIERMFPSAAQSP